MRWSNLDFLLGDVLIKGPWIHMMLDHGILDPSLDASKLKADLFSKKMTETKLGPVALVLRYDEHWQMIDRGRLPVPSTLKNVVQIFEQTEFSVHSLESSTQRPVSAVLIQFKQSCLDKPLKFQDASFFGDLKDSWQLLKSQTRLFFH
jgi:hypothetical protein